MSVASSIPASVNDQEVNVKYEKLAAEYSKLKAQAAVLKKAVIEEQNNIKELKQTIRIQEQSLRKNEQEIESLVFRNQQLTKRVIVLQDDLEEEKAAAKKGSKKTSVTAPVEKNGVLDEDFKRLAQDNAQLQTLILENEDQHLADITSLNKQIDHLRNELFKCQYDCRTVEDRYKPTIIKLEQEKLTKDNELKELQGAASSLELVQNKLSILEKNYKQMDLFANLLSKHFIFDGLNSMQLNNVNLTQESEQVIYKCIIDIVTALTSFLSQLRNQLDYFSNITGKDRYNSIKTVCDFGKEVIQTFIKEGQLDARTIIEYKNLLEIMLDSIKEISRNTSSLRSNLVDFISHLVQLFHSLPPLFLEKPKLYISSNLVVQIISELIVFEQLSKMLKLSFQTETDLELKSNGRNIQELVSVNDCFLESLTTLENFVQILANNLTQLLLGLDQILEESNAHCVLREFCERASKYLIANKSSNSKKSTNTDESEVEKAKELNELKCLYTKQLNQLQMQLLQLEKEKTQAQYQQEMNVIKKESTTEDIEVDRTLSDYFNEKINSLLEDKHIAEGKAKMMTSECVSLHRRLETLIDSEHQLQEFVVKWEQYASQLKDELRSTTVNYEAKHKEMCDTLVDLEMNLKAKEDIILNLNEQFLNKKSKQKS